MSELFAGKYRILREIGRGGTATVFLGEHVKTAERVAIKVLDVPDERFEREGEVLAQLQGLHIVRMLDFGRTGNGSQYILSEWIDGEPLSRLLQREEVLPPEVVADFVEQLLIALEEAHRLGIVHRDIKPGNVMVVDGNFIKVLDFGTARPLEARQITSASQVMGTPRYLPPETLRGNHISPSIDVFAVGLLAYLMLVGRHPNEGVEVQEVVERQLDSIPFELPSYLPLEPAMRAWYNRMMSKNIDERPADAGVALMTMPPPGALGDVSTAPQRSLSDITTNEVRLHKRVRDPSAETVFANVLPLPPAGDGRETKPAVLIEPSREHPRPIQKMSKTQMIKAKFWADVPPSLAPPPDERPPGEWTEGIPTVTLAGREVSIVPIALGVLFALFLFVVVMQTFVL